MNRLGRTILFAFCFMLAHIAAPAQKTKAERVSAQQLWSGMKNELTGPNAQEYFDGNFKGALVPGGAGSLAADRHSTVRRTQRTTPCIGACDVGPHYRGSDSNV